MSYVIGFNMPGYMPDMEPYQVDTFDEAKRCLISELKIAEDDADSEESAIEFSLEAEDVNLWSSEGTTNEMPDGYCYWIEEA